MTARQPALLSPYQPECGCILLAAVMFFLLLMPLFLLDAAQMALQKLHLSPTGALAVLAGIFVGSVINLPLYIIEHESTQPIVTHRLSNMMGWVPVLERGPERTIVAVNMGGCVIPVSLAVFETMLVSSTSPQAMGSLLIAVACNVVVCYFVAQPIPGLGIAMPAFTSPAVSVLVTWLLLGADEFALVRAPVAFVAGVMGPLIGADVLHLREVSKLAAPVVSIGGAGTFDGIVLSGLLAAFLV